MVRLAECSCGFVIEPTPNGGWHAVGESFDQECPEHGWTGHVPMFWK